MIKTISIFGDRAFGVKFKYLTDINKINIDKLLICSKLSYGKNEFICFLDTEIYTNYMPFFIKNQKLFGACNKKWGKISTIMQKGFYSKPV